MDNKEYQKKYREEHRERLIGYLKKYYLEKRNGERAKAEKEIKLCKCGCGNIVTNTNNSWINHHKKGWHHSQEAKDKVGKANSLYLDNEYIRKAFTEMDMTTIEIGKELGVCDGTIVMRLRKMGIDTHHKFTKKGRERVSQATKKRLKENPIIFTDEIRKVLSNKFKERWKDNDYKNMMSKAISKSMKGNPNARWKKTPEIKKKMSISRKKWLTENPEKALLGFQKSVETNRVRGSNIGEKNSGWLGGKSFEPYDENFSDGFKREIRKRDNQICMNCGIHREKLKESLSVHHINYDKLLSVKENCISLCRQCHRLTNGNREYWTKLFQEKLSKQYGYKYAENGNIIINICKEVEN